MKSPPVYPFIAPWILLSLIAGILGGLTRIGWQIPAANLAGLHGLIMVGGFLGTVISFEKTLPLKHKAWLIVPLISGLSVLFMVTGNYVLALYLQLIASLGLVIAMFRWLIQTKDSFYRIMIIGSLAWMVGISGLIAGRAIPSMLPWFMAFILFIIIGERLELTRFLPSSRFKKSLLYFMLTLYLAGIFIPYHLGGRHMLGISLAGISSWLLFNDLIKISIKKTGQHQYIAILLLAGYVWLLLTGIILIVYPSLGYMYDALVHSFFLGFAFSMIFAHGPIIVPGIIKKNYHLFSQSLYIWVIGFQLTLAIRLIGDIMSKDVLRMGGGIGNAIFIILFFVNIIVNVRKAATLSSR